MKKLFLLLLIISTTGCYSPILFGRVVDAETDLPIEGALVVAEWDSTSGIGFIVTEQVKVSDTLTNKNGRYCLLGILNPLSYIGHGCSVIGTFCLFGTARISMNKPDIAIYKEGYVGYRDNIIFPGFDSRGDFKYLFNKAKLEKWREGEKGYSHSSHYSFIHSGIFSTELSNAITEESKKDTIETQERRKKQEEREGKSK